MAQEKVTPLIRQFLDIKKQHPDALLLFQVGDFYELFFDDAKTASAFLGIALTKRGTMDGEPIPLCGVPVHARDHYVVKLVKGGFKVALCEQLEPPVPGKVVERGVTQVLTPGTLTDTKLLDEKSASYLCSFFPMNNSWGLLFGELLTAQLYATVLPHTGQKILEAELQRFFPDEVLLPADKHAATFVPLFKQCGYFTSSVSFDQHGQAYTDAHQWMEQQFNQQTTQALHAHHALRNSLVLFYDYVRRTQTSALEQFTSVHLYQPDEFLILDGATQRNLELVKNQRGDRANTLLSVIDGAVTPMGSRTIKKWLVRPLLNAAAINRRLDVVEKFCHDTTGAHGVRKILTQLGDLERVIGRIALHRAQVHDYLHLKRALLCVPSLTKLLASYPQIELLSVVLSHCVDFSSLHQLLDAALHDEPGGEYIIKPSFDVRLDELRELVNNSNQKIVQLEQREQQRTGINSLKIRFTNAHGYYIEVTKTNLHLVPDDYVRQQTLVGRERFTTQELKNLQADIFQARQEISSVEAAVFDRVKREVAVHVGALRKLAHGCAHLDALLGFANVASDHSYVRPTFNDQRIIAIEQGRHPVVERTTNSSFIANDVSLNDDHSLLIITGPNMGGKSTYLRQVALTSIMAQCGSFVPAASAHLPVLDRIFTRIGAGDNVADGKSTFLVEMEETAAICSQATKNSLVILDEVGRGTSTFDGLAIAQAVIEYLYTAVGARCLFATHYHELTALADQFSGISCLHATSKQTANGILFLHKIAPGIADGSFGLEVARLAQLPPAVVDRAGEIVDYLTTQGATQVVPAVVADTGQAQKLRQKVTDLQQQLAAANELMARIAQADINELSPRQAFDLVWQVHAQLTEAGKKSFEV